MMLICELDVTQQDLRNVEQLPEMIEYVKSGGFFTLEAVTAYASVHNGCHPDLIEIAEFEDGRRYLRNGHHRAVAIWLGGRDRICPEEYRLTKWRYSDFEGIKFVNGNGEWVGWVTPFNVRTHVRIANLAEYKRKVKSLYWGAGEAAATDFIINNRELYCEPKRFDGVADLAASLSLETEATNEI